MTTATANPGARRVEQIMGMPILVDVRDDGVGEGALDPVFDWFRDVDETFSTYKPESEVSRLARGELRIGDASPDVQEVLARCEELREETDGYFDACADGRLDPSGLVKGWSVDHAAAMLGLAGFADFAVNAGGDIRLVGRARPESSWRVGIQHPLVRTGSRPSSRATISRSPRQAPTHAATTCSIRIRGGRRPGSCPSRSPVPISRPRTRMRRPPSRWARIARPPGRRRCRAATRR
jgi:thiamine biosynthesis lipoprotein ApbE